MFGNYLASQKGLKKSGPTIRMWHIFDMAK